MNDKNKAKEAALELLTAIRQEHSGIIIYFYSLPVENDKYCIVIRGDKDLPNLSASYKGYNVNYRNINKPILTTVKEFEIQEDATMHWRKIINKDIRTRHESRKCLFCKDEPLHYLSLINLEKPAKLECRKCRMTYFDNPEPKWEKSDEGNMFYWQWISAINLWDIVDRDSHIRSQVLLKRIVQATTLEK